MVPVTDISEHGAAPAYASQPPAPLHPPAALPLRRRSAAEEARTLVAGASQGVLASLSADGAPWGSVVTYGALADGAPVLLVSLMAEHTRNLEADPRASLVVAEPPNDDNPLDRGRVTLAGRAVQPEGDPRAAARAAHLAAIPSAELYADFDDFRLFVLEVERVRWVGGYGRMDTVDAAGYAVAAADPVAPHADGAVRHLNADHADALLEVAVALAGFTDATRARCTGVDRYGLDLEVDAPRGTAHPRVGFPTPVDAPDGLRGACVELVQRARDAH
jgi:putative heme iron utilization protein